MGRIKDFFTFGRQAELLAALDQSPSLTFSEDTPVSIDEYVRRLNADESLAPRISRRTALTIPAVKRGRDLIVGIATFPLVTYRGDNEVVLNELLRQIDPFGVINLKTIAMTVEDLLFEGVSYWRITATGSNGYPSKAYHLNCGSVTVQEPSNARPTVMSSGVHPEGQVYVDGVKVPKNEIIRFDSPNDPLLKTVGRVVRSAVQASLTSQMYLNNPMPMGVFTPKADADPFEDEDDVRNQISKFAVDRNESPYAYIGAALDFQAFDNLNPANLQLVEIERMVNIGIANAMGVELEVLGINTTSRVYQNDVDRRKNRINDLLSPYMEAIEQTLSSGSVTPRGYYVRFDPADYFQPDPETRMKVNTGYLAAGVMTVDEVRQREGLAPLTPQQKSELAQAKAMQSLGRPLRVQSTLGNPMELTAHAESEHGFSDTSISKFDVMNDASFAVDEEKRIIRGLVVPFGQEATSKGQRWQFLPGSLKFSDLSRVKLLRDHDQAQLLGKATEFRETERGIEMEFSVAPGVRGDEALALAKHGSLDGLSVGVKFIDTYTDPKTPGVNYVRAAHLNEVSACGIPAFADSRISGVYSEGKSMNCTRCGDDDHEVSACTAPDPETTFSVKDFKRYQQIQAMFAATEEAAKKPLSVQEDTTVPPREVPEQKTNEAVFVQEPSPYTFSSDSQFSLTNDIKRAAQMDDEAAQKRLHAFFDAEFAVTAANTATLNPTIQRPDMYVDNLSYEYPIWDTINKGAPPNGVTPFQFPKWNSSTTLVADHVEGTEPTLGGFTVTSQTVTPTALSGKIEINREAWDQMGQPNLDNLVRAEMRRAWFEGLETASAAFLDGLTLTDITITTAAADSALHQELLGDLVDLLFTRGGYRMRNFLVQANLYKKLALAKDSDGRLLFPAINPTNAAGTLASFFANLNINGLIGRPAWALGPASANADNSYLFAREDVHGWATTPEFKTFDIQVKSIYIGIWGYKAFANSRAAGVRRFIYDPV